jgi:non-specific serine/threonine protein kinase
LFVSRAQAARPDFALTLRNAEAVARLCQRLEGIPLALELAAAWAQTLTPAQMLDRLEKRFDLLVSRRRDAPGRHATLRATVEWSYRLLPDDLQRFFARLSVFQGGWTLEAAEAVTGEADALRYLTELRERSLVLCAEEDPEEEEAPCDAPEDMSSAMRFRMLETLREFAAERMDDSTRDDVSGRTSVTFFVSPRKPSRICGERSKRRGWAAWKPNTRTCARPWPGRWRRRTGSGGNRGRSGSPFSGALAWFWLMHNHVREGREWLGRALEASAGRPPPLPPCGPKRLERGLACVARPRRRRRVAFERGRPGPQPRNRRRVGNGVLPDHAGDGRAPRGRG